MLFDNIILTLKCRKADDKFTPANFQKMICASNIQILRSQRNEGKQCRSRLGGSDGIQSSSHNRAIGKFVLVTVLHTKQEGHEALNRSPPE